MKINFNSIPVYRMWREGTSKKVGSKGMPGSKIQKKMVREAIKRSFRGQSLAKNAGLAEHQLEKGVLTDKHGNPVKRFRPYTIPSSHRKKTRRVNNGR